MKSSTIRTSHVKHQVKVPVNFISHEIGESSHLRLLSVLDVAENTPMLALWVNISRKYIE